MSKAKAYHLIEDFPNKLYYTIAEVADDVGVEQSALRFWENEFDILKPKRDPKGRRQYTKKDVLTVRQIYDLVKIEGLSLEGAKAKIKNKKGECETTTGWAREEETKKGMDGSQITGASSSYARKYALNGLFAIDDNADSDTTNDGQHQAAQQQAQTQAQQTATPQYHTNDLNEGLAFLSRCVNKDNLVWVVQTYKPLTASPQFMQAVSAKKKELGIQ